MEAIAKTFLVPSGMIMLAGISSLTLVCFRHGRKLGVRLGIVAFLLYIIFGAGPVAFLLLGHLEYWIPPAQAAERANVQTIVVLAAHAEPDPNIPLSSHINSPSAFRVLEALKLFREAPNSSVIVSGEGSVPKVIGEVLIASGIPTDHLRIDADSSSTAESAKRLQPVLGRSPFLLVTSAGHMPRAVKVFQKAGMAPRAAPTHYLTRRNWLAIQYLPSPLHLKYSDLAVSEYMGLFWYRLNGWL